MNRLEDPYNRSLNRGIYTYSGFMYEADAAEAYAAAGSPAEVTLYGGFPEAGRVVVRFGNPEEIVYEEPFPIAVLEISPLNAKFSDDLTHRDFLGSLMNLGIERDVIGDILIKNNKAWACILENMSGHICRELTRVKHTSVNVQEAPGVPEDARPEKQTVLINVASSRADAVVSGYCNISRTRAAELFRAGAVFRNGRECRNADRKLNENDAVTVRGYGKFFYKGIRNETKKKREVVIIEKYK